MPRVPRQTTLPRAPSVVVVVGVVVVIVEVGGGGGWGLRLVMIGDRVGV